MLPINLGSLSMGVDMAKILKVSDRVNLRVGEITFTLSPLNYLQKQELAECTRMVGGEEVFDLLKAQVYYIKHSLKDIDGVEDFSGDRYELEFENDCLTDNCVSEILCLEEKEKLTIAAWQILNGIKDLVDPVSGKKLAGVKLEVESGK